MELFTTYFVYGLIRNLMRCEVTTVLSRVQELLEYIEYAIADIDLSDVMTELVTDLLTSLRALACMLDKSASALRLRACYRASVNKFVDVGAKSKGGNWLGKIYKMVTSFPAVCELLDEYTKFQDGLAKHAYDVAWAQKALIDEPMSIGTVTAHNALFTFTNSVVQWQISLRPSFVESINEKLLRTVVKHLAFVAAAHSQPIQRRCVCLPSSNRLHAAGRCCNEDVALLIGFGPRRVGLCLRRVR